MAEDATSSVVRTWPHDFVSAQGAEVLRTALSAATERHAELGRSDLRELSRQRHGEEVFSEDNAWLVTLLDREVGDAEQLWGGVVWAPRAFDATSIVTKGGLVPAELPEYRIELLQLTTGMATQLTCRRQMPELEAAVEQLRRLLVAGRTLSGALRELLVAYPRWHGGEVFRLLREGCSLDFQDACRADEWEGIGSVGVDDEQLDAELGPKVAAALGLDGGRAAD
jgi:hypothetical protein